MVAALFAVVAIVVVAAIFGVREIAAPPGCGSSDECTASAPGGATFVATGARGAIDATLRTAADGSVALVTLRGHRRWRLTTASAQAPRLLAAGDVSGDGVTDYVLGLVRPQSPARTCGRDAMQTTSFLVVNGRTGRTSTVMPPAADICWRKPTFTYPTQQWAPGTVYITELTPRVRGAELVAVPYYAKDGAVWNLAQTGRWQRVGTFPWPSTPRFDQAYDAANPGAPCTHPVTGGPCFVENSHVANAVTLPGGTGLFALTSARAVIYRPDLTPTSDATWFPAGDPSNGGRNYGLVEAYRTGGQTYVDLLGGCSVAATQRAMLPGGAAAPGDVECGVVRHVERFAVQGAQIAQHQTIFYGYAPAIGAAEGRLEFPGHPRAALGGPGTSWTAYNLRRGGTWSAQVLQGPMTTSPIALPGWYVWDTLPGGRGSSELLASRVAPGAVTPDWGFDVLRWDGSAFRSVRHVDGEIPMLVAYPSSPALHDSEGAVSGVLLRGRRLLVADREGDRRFVTISDARS